MPLIQQHHAKHVVTLAQCGFFLLVFSSPSGICQPKDFVPIVLSFCDVETLTANVQAEGTIPGETLLHLLLRCNRGGSAAGAAINMPLNACVHAHITHMLHFFLSSRFTALFCLPFLKRFAPLKLPFKNNIM